MKQDVEVLDRTLALAGVGGDLEFFGQLAGIAQAAWPTLLHNIDHALQRQDLRELKRAAELIKVTAQNLSARRAYLAAFLLENMAEWRELEGAREAALRLKEEIERLQSALVALHQESTGTLFLGENKN